MKARQVILTLVGLAAAGAVIASQGIDDVAVAFAAAGWGLVWVTLFHAAPLFLDMLAWRSLLDGEARPALGRLMALRWTGESVNNLLPVAQVGGDFVRARLLHATGVPGAAAGASVVVDFTLGLLTKVMFMLLGLALMASVASDRSGLGGLAIGVAVLGLLIFGFVLAQRAGLFGGLANLAVRLARRWEGGALHAGASDLDRQVRQLYRCRDRMALGSTFRLAGWLVGAGEIWLGLYFLGHPIGLAESIGVFALIVAVRAAGFAVPGALGIQEGGFVLVGALVGVPPEVALALALVRRVREILFGIPGLICWSAFERGGAPASTAATGTDPQRSG